MENKRLLVTHQPWTAWEKTGFRFFFIFLSLQVLTENFLGNLFGYTLTFWKLAEDIFVPPCLWLNSHIFHFHYVPESWTTFSASLHTIRDTVYLLFAFSATIIWTILDRKRASYYKLHYWFAATLLTGLSCFMYAYGIMKLIPVQMAPPNILTLEKPVGQLSPFDMLWATLGYGTPYQVFSGICEIAGALLILFKRTRVAGLLIIASSMLNVIVFNYAYQVGVLITSFYILIITLFLLVPYAGSLSRFFFQREQAVLGSDRYVSGKNYKTILSYSIAIAFIACSFISDTIASFNRYRRSDSINKSRQYSVVKNYILSGDTIRPLEADTSCWKIWNERTVNNKRMVTISRTDPDIATTYTLEQDSLNHILLMHSSGDTTTLRLSYKIVNDKDWKLEGMIKGNEIKIELQRFSPDTLYKLLKAKREIITFNDE